MSHFRWSIHPYGEDGAFSDLGSGGGMPRFTHETIDGLMENAADERDSPPTASRPSPLQPRGEVHGQCRRAASYRPCCGRDGQRIARRLRAIDGPPGRCARRAGRGQNLGRTVKACDGRSARPEVGSNIHQACGAIVGGIGVALEWMNAPTQLRRIPCPGRGWRRSSWMMHGR